MSQSLGKFAPKNRQSEETEDAELLTSVDAHHIADFEQYRKPMIFERLRQLPYGAHAVESNLEDAHWYRARKAVVFGGQLEAEANYGVGRRLFLQNRSAQEAIDCLLSFQSIRTLKDRYGNSLTLTF